MNKFLLLLVALQVIGLAEVCVGADQVKVRYAGTIYTDISGVALKEPAGVTISGDTLLVADSGGKRILSFRLEDGKAVPDKNIPLPDMFPLMVQQAASGDFYVLDGRERQIAVVGANGMLKGDLAIKGLPEDTRVVPRSFKVAADGTIFVLDIFSERVLILEEGGQYRSQVDFPASYGSFSDVEPDNRGNLYILDGVDGVLYKAEQGADSFSRWSEGLKDYTNFPVSMAADGTGNLLLLDKHGSGVAVVGPDGRFAGRKLAMGWADGQLYYPTQISVNAKGNLFIADTANHRVQQFNIAE